MQHVDELDYGPYAHITLFRFNKVADAQATMFSLIGLSMFCS